MKTILLSSLFLAFFCVAQAQSKPSIEETYDYIQNLLEEADEYTLSYSSGALDKIIIKNYNLNFKLKKGQYFYQGIPQITSLGCNDKNAYTNIDFSKLVGEPVDDESGISSSSSLRKLKITFIPNSVLKERWGDCSNNHGSKPVSEVIFFYRNEDGVNQRLIKAILHLSKLRKEEEKSKSDPFAN